VPKGKRPTATRRARPKGGAKPAAVRALERRVARLTGERDADRRRHARQVAAARRAADRRLAAAVAEIAALRHLEARADALTRLLAEREATLEIQGQRIAHLERLLQNPPEVG
jgi:hypothetical protein